MITMPQPVGTHEEPPALDGFFPDLGSLWFLSHASALVHFVTGLSGEHVCPCLSSRIHCLRQRNGMQMLCV